MEELNQIVRNYLEAQNTDYAIMINGDWGSGKSYYIKHDFCKVVTDVDYKQQLSESESMLSKATEVSTKVHKDQRNSDHLTKYDAKKYYPFI